MLMGQWRGDLSPRFSTRDSGTTLWYEHVGCMQLAARPRLRMRQRKGGRMGSSVDLARGTVIVIFDVAFFSCYNGSNLILSSSLE